MRYTTYPKREKEDIIDWAQLPTGECEMNFRPPKCLELRRTNKLHIAIVSAIAAIGLVFGFQLLLKLIHGKVTLDRAGVLAMIIVFSLLVAWSPFRDTRNVFRQTARFFAYVVFSQLALFYFIMLLGDSGFHVFVMALAVAILVFASLLCDSIAKHYVYWCTASPLFDRKIMVALRTAWNHRFWSMGTSPLRPLLNESNQSRDIMRLQQELIRYKFRFLFVPTIVVALGCTALFFCRDLCEGRVFVLSLALSLIAIVTLQECLNLGAMGQSIYAFRHHFFYATDITYPPWVFQSTSGAAPHRQLHTSLVLAIVCFTVHGIYYNGTSFYVSIQRSTIEQSALDVVAIIVGATVIFFGTLCIAIGPPVSAFARLCESNDSPLAKKNWTPFDAYSDRLRYSLNSTERDSIWIGFHETLKFPILVSVELIREHMHILGATGIGKTALGVSTLITQLIRRGDGPVIILDCKGDNALFNTTRIEAEKANKTFKWFTNQPNKSTYIFNPFQQKHLREMNLQELIGLFIQSFNLHHGDDYGRSWFSATAQAAFRETLKMTQRNPPGSFVEFQKYLEQVMADHNEYKAAQHLAFIMQSLSEFEQLNLNSKTNDHPANKHAIHMPEVIEEKQVIYFSLVAASDLSTASEISRLAMYSVLSAAMNHLNKTGRPPNVYLVIDEAQNVIAKNIEVVLAQARSFGLACILCHQSLSQLKPPGGVDLTDLVLNCTCIKQVFSARDECTRKYLSAMSGSVGYVNTSWTQFASSVMKEDIGHHRAIFRSGYDPAAAEVQVTEVIGPRLTDEDIEDFSRNSNCCALGVARNHGYSCFRGMFPVHVDWPLSIEEYGRRSHRMSWPADSQETMSMRPFWPNKSAETIVAKNNSVAQENCLSQEQLEKLGRQIFGEMS